MLTEQTKKQIISIWDKYVADNKKVHDTKGNQLDDIDGKRLVAIETLKTIIKDFLKGHIDINEFKTEIDSFNKHNNLWGFTAIKGQMFFNLLLKTGESEDQIKKLTGLLKDCISDPNDLPDALRKVAALGKYTSNIFNEAPDKRKAPHPGSVCYFLSYFWQIQNYQKWPIMYSSIIISFTDIGLWIEPSTSKEAYNVFYNLYEEIKGILSEYTGKKITNWEAEHSFWSFRKVGTSYKPAKLKEEKQLDIEANQNISTLIGVNFNIYDFIPPITAKLIELGNETETSGSAKGSKFEKAVCEVFKQLGFNIQYLGQGSGREPDLIAIHKEDNEAFIIDAKAYANGYMLSAGDERAIREYISHYCPRLQRDGIKKIGFLVVSNSFKPGFDSFINEITWKTDIKRFSLLSSDALLHLLAYKIKDQLHLSEIIEAIISLGTLITSKDIIQKFDDI
jgi:hypothetical protein